MKLRSTLFTAAALSMTTLAFPVSAAAATRTTATEAAGKVPAKKDHFHQRIEDITAAVAAIPSATTGTVVMLGDSITEGFFHGDTMPKDIGGLMVINEGISGDQIDFPANHTGVTTRIELVKKARPTVVFVMIGINDFWGGKESPEDVLPQYEKMFHMLKSAVPDAHIVLESVLPTGKANAYMNPNVKKLNDLEKQLAEKNGATYLDLHPVMADEKGELKDEFTADGVHLKPAGYAVWLKELQQSVAKLMK